LLGEIKRKCAGYKITKEGFGWASRMHGSFRKLYTLSVRESGRGNITQIVVHSSIEEIN
jgi:hypothetical protein